MGLEEYETRLRHLEQILKAFIAERDDDTARELAKLITVGGIPKQFNGKVTVSSTEGLDPEVELTLKQMEAFAREYDENAVNSLYGKEIAEYFDRRKELNQKAKRFNLDELPNLRHN